jgi:hypothetical protein
MKEYAKRDAGHLIPEGRVKLRWLEAMIISTAK